jgi:ABC-type amino acid transport substrate-binding protein
MAAAARGEADAVVIDAVSLALFNRAGGDLVAVGQPLRSDPYVVVVPAGSPLLLADLNRTLDTLAGDGTLAALRAKWLGP